MHYEKPPKDWIDWIQTICLWVIVAAFVIFMLPVFAMVALIWLVGLGPDAASGPRRYREPPPPGYRY